MFIGTIVATANPASAKADGMANRMKTSGKFEKCGRLKDKRKSSSGLFVFYVPMER
jgi:hypothetical protein